MSTLFPDFLDSKALIRIGNGDLSALREAAAAFSKSVSDYQAGESFESPFDMMQKIRQQNEALLQALKQSQAVVEELKAARANNTENTDTLFNTTV